ncbi:MAG: hypothetical protein WBO46_04855, partial [Caldilineaceae bacterium]
MAYGLKYQGEFDSISEDGYRIEILQKEYTGPFFTLQMAGVPVVHNWGPDDPKAAVKGSSLTINYLNKGDYPIEVFFSNNDDEFKVIFYQGSQVLFVGFLVQDDIYEPMNDFTHEVTLSANDNLGLLKDVALNKNPLNNQSTTVEGDFISIVVPPQNWIYLRNSAYLPVVGTPFNISGHPSAAMNGNFTPITVNVLSTGNYNVRTNTFTGDQAAAPANVNGYGGYFNFYAKESLLNIIALCLQNTGLGLETYIYENLFEVSQVNTKSSLEQTFIDVQTFISGEVFMSCYDVLTKICERFNMTLFQAKGRWNIIRWDEMRQGTGINGFVYDSTFTQTGTTTLDEQLTFGFEQDTYPEAGLRKTIFRPWQFDKETFNYEQPKYLLNNYDLQTLGALLRTYNSGANIVKEYVATGWTGTNGNTTPSERFIRVVSDALLNELERYLVIRGNTSESAMAVPSDPIEANIGDKISFSFSVRTNDDQAPGIGAVFAVRMYNG